MDFDSLRTDSVDLLKRDGTKRTGLKASVQTNRVYMGANGLLIEPEDLLLRRMSNGAEETYRVIDPGFREAFHSIAANYQMTVEKLGAPQAKMAVHSITYNLNGPNARVNQHSTDNSTNLVQVDARVSQHLQALRQAVEAAALAPADKSGAQEIVGEIESAFQSGAPKKSVVSALLASLGYISSVATIAEAIKGLL
jgi:hypothetical protein